MTTIFAKKFSSRQDLENSIRGTPAFANPANYQISGTRAELEILHLTDQETVFGIVCKITDTPTEYKNVNKPERGERLKSKLT